MSDYAKLCEELQEIGSRYPNQWLGNAEQVAISGLCLTARHTIEALQASAAEKDKRIAELQAENESIRDILFDADGTNLVNYWYQQTQIAENGCRNYADENASLQAERDAAIAESKELRDDFVSFVLDGVQNPAPYCANKCKKCVDGRDWCIGRSCIGFRPSARRGVRHDSEKEVERLT